MNIVQRGTCCLRLILPALRCRPLQLTGEVKRCLNLGSYNYLGFAAADDYCTPRVLDSLRDLGWSSCGSRGVAGALRTAMQRMHGNLCLCCSQCAFGISHKGIVAAQRRRTPSQEMVYGRTQTIVYLCSDLGQDCHL